MSHSDIEIIYDSRETEQRYGYFRQTIVLKACLDESEGPLYPSFAFPPDPDPPPPGYTTPFTSIDDMVAIEYFDSILPETREIVTGFAQDPSSPAGAIVLFRDASRETQLGGYSSLSI